MGGPVREKATDRGAGKEALTDRERGIMRIAVKLETILSKTRIFTSHQS